MQAIGGELHNILEANFQARCPSPGQDGTRQACDERQFDERGATCGAVRSGTAKLYKADPPMDL